MTPHRVIDRYAQTIKLPPRRLVVHKQSRFFPEELAGFQDAFTRLRIRPGRTRPINRRDAPRGLHAAQRRTP
jgi:hypothetical protein